MSHDVDVRRVLIYLGLAFGIAWATSLVIYLTGGLGQSPMLFPEAGVSLALVLLAGPVMWAPAIAHGLTRLLTRERWERVSLRPQLRRAWPYWVAAWLLPGLLTIVGMAAYFLTFPHHYDASLGLLREMLAAQLPEGAGLEELNVWALAAVQVAQAILIAPILNSVATFGEEFGWRGYLQPELLGLGTRRALLLTGATWGIWHWPVILMGYNYGFDYPGAPVLGPLAMVWFTVVVGTLLGWLTLRGESVWPAVIGHAALNGVAGLGIIFVRGDPNTLLGPTPVGLIGGIGFTVVAGAILMSVNGRPAADEGIG
ncbi:MAG: CPBP family intramembrane glutamic endopeptidase [Chloroflexota bacterium]|nr:CPBP family intramembrane glutamic endopeptidase [Chloroflexota bacterium]